MITGYRITMDDEAVQTWLANATKNMDQLHAVNKQMTKALRARIERRATRTFRSAKSITEGLTDQTLRFSRFRSGATSSTHSDVSESMIFFQGPLIKWIHVHEGVDLRRNKRVKQYVIKPKRSVAKGGKRKAVLKFNTTNPKFVADNPWYRRQVVVPARPFFFQDYEIMKDSIALAVIARASEIILGHGVNSVYVAGGMP